MARSTTVSVYFEAASDLAVNTPDQQVVSSRYQLDGQPVLRMGSRDQAMLAKRGDDLRIDWGYLYLAADQTGGRFRISGSASRPARAFVEHGPPARFGQLSPMPRPRRATRPPSLAFGIALGNVSSRPVSRYLMLAYDDLYSIQYFERRERPYWRRNGMDAAELLRMGRRGSRFPASSAARRSTTS